MRGSDSRGWPPSGLSQHQGRGIEPIPGDRLARREAPPDSTQAAREVLAQLLRDGYRPGDRIPSERRLAEALGVGRAVIYEALRSLSLLGIVQLRQGDGTFLSTSAGEALPKVSELGLLLGPRLIADLMQVGSTLEADIAGHAAERRTGAVLTALDANQEDLERVLARPADLIDPHREFHLLLRSASSNHVLAEILASICALLDVSISAAIEAEKDHAWIVSDHRRVLEAIRHRDPVRAHAEMALHMRAIARLLTDVPLPPLGQPRSRRRHRARPMPDLPLPAVALGGPGAPDPEEVGG